MYHTWSEEILPINKTFLVLCLVSLLRSKDIRSAITADEPCMVSACLFSTVQQNVSYCSLQVVNRTSATTFGCCVNNQFDAIEEVLAIQGLRFVAIVNMYCCTMPCQNVFVCRNSCGEHSINHSTGVSCAFVAMGYHKNMLLQK